MVNLKVGKMGMMKKIREDVEKKLEEQGRIMEKRK